jgi:MFS transporter, DHA1 family, tetracycline resistance protein
VTETDRESRSAVRRRVLGLYPAVGVSFFGYAMMATLFVPMVLTRTDGYLPASDSYATRTTILGGLLVLYPLGQFLGNPVLGGLSDRWGRRPLVLASGAATVVCYVGIALALQAKSLIALAPILLVCGFVEANLALAISAIADVTDDEQRPRYVGYMFAVTSVAYTLGPPFGGLLVGRFGYAAPFWVVLGLLVVILVWLQQQFTETLPASRRRRLPLLHTLGALSQVVTDRLLRRIYLGNLLVAVSAMGFWRVVTIYLVDEWHLRVQHVTANYALFAIAAGTANLVLMPPLSKRMSVRRLCLISVIGGAVSVAAMALPDGIGAPHALVFAVLLGALASLFLALAMASGTAVISSAAPADRQGTVLGNNSALIVLGEVAGTSVGSFVAGIDSADSLIAMAVVAVLAAVVFSGRLPVLGVARDAPESVHPAVS